MQANLGVKKCIMEPNKVIPYLGIECNTTKWEKLLALIREIMSKGLSNFNELEKVVGKCRSMSITVPEKFSYPEI